MTDMEFKGSANRIRKCACDLLSIGGDLMDDDDSWDLIRRDLQLKSTFLYCDFNKMISSAPKDQKKALAELANKLFCSIEETAGSLGELAGFAIAVLFAWKFSLGSRRLRKHTTSASTSGASLPVDDFRSPEKLALAQMVKKKLLGGRKMTCQLLGVILEESTPEELQEHATVRSPAVEVLLEISKVCDIYLMETILDDDSEERVISALERAGLFEAGGLMKEKVLFCSTQNGRLSFVRQLEPDWHVDTDPDVLSQLSKFVRNQLHISPAGSNFATGSTISSATSLDLYFMGGGV